MSGPAPGLDGAAADRKGLALAAAVTACLWAAGSAQAQAMYDTYQSPMRGSVGTGFGQTAMAPGGLFQPRVDTAVQYVDNINLAPDGQKAVNTWGLELSPGFYASYSTDSVTAAIDYTLTGRAWADSEYNDVAQYGAANGRWIAVPDLFYLDAQGSISDAVINPQDGLNYGGLGIFGAGNLSQQAAASATPTFSRRFGDFEAMAQYSYGRVWYFDQGQTSDEPGFNGLDNSVDQNAIVSVGTADSGRKLSGSVFYNWQRSSFQDSLPYVYERLGTDLAWMLSPRLSLVGDAGLESDLDQSTTAGGLDSGYWNAGVRWRPDERTFLEARYGRRFFGDTYFLSAQRSTRMFEFSASYNESPEVGTRTDSLPEFIPGELPPGVDPSDFGRLNSYPYVSKNANASVRAIGSRTTVGLNYFWSQQDYIRAPISDDSYGGVSLDVSRQLASNLSADFTATYTDYGQTQLISGKTTNDYDTQLTVNLNREVSEKLSTSLEAGYLHRSGQETFDGWWLGLRARWSP